MSTKKQKSFSSFAELKKYSTQQFALTPSGDTILSKAIKAYQANLYVPLWNNQSIFTDIIKNYSSTSKFENFHISLIEDEQTKQPVAVAIISLEDRYISTFVDPNYRGQNLGSKIIDKALSETNLSSNQIYSLEGIAGSDIFYQKNGVMTFPNIFNSSNLKKLNLEHLINNPSAKISFIEKQIKEKKESLNTINSFNSSVKDILKKHIPEHKIDNKKHKITI